MNSVPRLVLASGSIRRRELLELLGLRFDVVPAALEEAVLPGETAAAHVERLAGEKALHVARRNADALVIGCDTAVVLPGGEILGKPRDARDAVNMLLRLQGGRHRVETGVAVAAPGGRLESAVESVEVRFRSFDVKVAEEYVATGEPLDKAGAYGIQGLGSTLVAGIAGDFFAVVGLPLVRLLSLLELLGWRFDFGGLVPRER